MTALSDWFLGIAAFSLAVTAIIHAAAWLVLRWGLVQLERLIDPLELRVDRSLRAVLAVTGATATTLNQLGVQYWNSTPREVAMLHSATSRHADQRGAAQPQPAGAFTRHSPERATAHERRPRVLASFPTLLKQAIKAWSDDYAPSMGAALSYYTIFSLAPLLIIAIAFAGVFFGEEAARGHIVGALGGLIGQQGGEAIQEMVQQARGKSTSVIASIISFATLLVGATTVFGELQSALDRIWRAPARTQRSGIVALLRGRLLSFGLVVSIGFLLLVSLMLSAAVAALGTWGARFFPGWEVVLQVLNSAIGFLVTGVMFAAIYRVLPSVHIPWRDVWTGAWVTALLFTLGKFAIGLYLGKAAVTSTFGAAGSLVLLLVWVYYSAQIFLLGAEFTWVYAQHDSSRALYRPPVPAPEEPSTKTTASTLATT